MNGRQIRTLLTIMACLAVHTTMTDAGKHIVSTPMTAADARKEWVVRHSSGELQFITMSEGACSTCTLDVQLFPSDGSNCSYAEDVLLQNYDLVMQLMSVGFTTLSCDAFDESGKIVSTERRDISTGYHPAPAAPAVSPAPRIEPRKHTPTASDPIALA
jgi:hypothetical protein